MYELRRFKNYTDNLLKNPLCTKKHILQKIETITVIQSKCTIHWSKNSLRKSKVKYQMTVQEPYKTKFSSATEDLLDSCIMPYSNQWWYILQKNWLIKSNVCIKPTYEDGIICITVIGKWHSKLMPCINQRHRSFHYILIYRLLKS